MFQFGDGFQFGLGAAAVGIVGIGLAGIDDFDVLQGQVLDGDSGDALDAAGAYVAGEILYGAFIAVAGVRFVQGNFGIDILDDDILHVRIVAGVAGTGADEDGVAGVQAAQAVNLHVFNLGAVHGGDGDGRTVGVHDGHVPEAEVLELTAGVGTELDAVGAAAAAAVLHQDVLGDTVLGVALEAVHVVGGVEVAVADDDVGAVHDVNAVIVPVALGIYGHTLHQDAAALVVLLVPAGRILQGDVLDSNVFTAEEMQVFRAFAFLQAVQLEGILNEAQVAVIHALGGYQEAPAIDFAAAGDADVLLSHRKDQGGPFGVGILHIVPGVQGTQETGAFLDVQGDIVLEVDGAGDEISSAQDEPAAAVGGDVVDGSLEHGRVQAFTIGFCTEIGGQVVLGCGGQGKHRAKQQDND